MFLICNFKWHFDKLVTQFFLLLKMWRIFWLIFDPLIWKFHWQFLFSSIGGVKIKYPFKTFFSFHFHSFDYFAISQERILDIYFFFRGGVIFCSDVSWKKEIMRNPPHFFSKQYFYVNGRRMCNFHFCLKTVVSGGGVNVKSLLLLGTPLPAAPWFLTLSYIKSTLNLCQPPPHFRIEARK